MGAPQPATRITIENHLVTLAGQAERLEIIATRTHNCTVYFLGESPSDPTSEKISIKDPKSSVMSRLSSIIERLESNIISITGDLDDLEGMQ